MGLYTSGHARLDRLNAEIRLSPDADHIYLVLTTIKKSAVNGEVELSLRGEDFRHFLGKSSFLLKVLHELGYTTQLLENGMRIRWEGR